MDPQLIGALVALSVIDSTSFGTLLIPIWLLLSPGKPKPGRVVLFLGTVAGVYFLLGFLILSGLDSIVGEIGALLDNEAVRIAQLVAAVGLMVLGVTIEPWTREGKERKAARRAIRGPGRLQRWRRRVMDGSGPAGSVLGLALTATAIEAGSMVPYLAALGVLSTSRLTMMHSGLLLAGYCLVMILPATLLLVARWKLHDQVAPLLRRIEGWMTRNAGEMTAWILFLVGLFLAADAVRAIYL